MKILIIRFSSIGDIVMMSPVARCLKKQLGAEVHFLTKKIFSSLVDQDPYIDQVLYLQENIQQTAEGLKTEAYDWVIDLHNNIRSNQLCRFLGVPKKKIDKLTKSKWLKIYTHLDRLPSKHVAHRALETVEHLAVVDDEEGMQVFVNERIESLFGENPYLSIGLATAKKTKNIPKDLFQKILLDTKHNIVLLGSKIDEELGESLAKIRPGIVNLAGKTSLAESMMYVKNSKVFLGGDTGLLHIACAMKLPTISIWGATIPEFGVYPYYGKYDIPHKIHELQMNCRPCSKHGTQKCPKLHFNCMNLQDEQAIISSMNELFLSE